MTLREFHNQARSRFKRIMAFTAVTLVIFVPLLLNGTEPKLYLTALLCTLFGGTVASWADLSEVKKASEEGL